MVTESPSLLLQRAADELLRLAYHYGDYEKQAADDLEMRPEHRWASDVTGSTASAGAKRWVKVMNPLVALSLANWLRDKADEVVEARCFREVVDSPAYELACLILNERKGSER